MAIKRIEKCCVECGGKGAIQGKGRVTVHLAGGSSNGVRYRHAKVCPSCGGTGIVVVEINIPPKGN